MTEIKITINRTNQYEVEKFAKEQKEKFVSFDEWFEKKLYIDNWEKESHEMDVLQEPDGVYRICWECKRKESLQWMKHND